MSSIAASIEDKTARGGQVLSILHDFAVTMAGDQSGKKICHALTETASQPYFRILESWIYKVYFIYYIYCIFYLHLILAFAQTLIS
jgi:gamma-tubulin complex component 2